MKQLSYHFFSRDTVQVAQDLLGKVISINGMTVRIVETEAYRDDLASHAFKRTERSALMFDTYGHVYVYLIYGMYYCLNFTTEKAGQPGAVLIRAVEPLSGIETMKINRQSRKLTPTSSSKYRKLTEAFSNNDSKKLTLLTSGPGKLCQALGIDRTYNGLIIGEEKEGREMNIYDDGFNVLKIGKSSRIGIKDALHLHWRFFIKENKFVSKV